MGQSLIIGTVFILAVILVTVILVVLKKHQYKSFRDQIDKLDTETIYAYLNSYQDKYIHDIYRNLDQIKSGSKMSAHVESVLQEMLRTDTISIDEAKNYT